MRQAGGAAERGGEPAAAVFRSALGELAAGREQATAARPELSFEDMPPPRTLAPHAAAFAATVESGGQEVASGRFVLLYDPAGQPGWQGPLRVVVWIRADLEPETAADPLLGGAAWSWLTEALARNCEYEAVSGTVTRVVSEGFGGKAGEPPENSMELRASWSPALPDGPAAGSGANLAGHVTAWCAALCAASGLPPLAAGVTALQPPGGRAGS